MGKSVWCMVMRFHTCCLRLYVLQLSVLLFDYVLLPAIQLMAGFVYSKSVCVYAYLHMLLVGTSVHKL